MALLYACKKVEKEMLVTTGSVSNILTTSADVTGSILDLGEGATNFGHCYSTSPNSSISGPKTDYSSPSTGGFTSALSGLIPATKYYVKAYLKRGNNVVYGDEITFSTASASLPQLTTAEVTGVSKTTAVSGGNVTSQGGTPVTARGVCWSLATNPVLTNSKSVDGEGTGNFSSNLTSLTAGTKYYVRAYATNSGGTAYGNEVSFTTISDVVNMPIVSTADVSLVTSNSASCGGNVTDEGGGVVTAKGVCWSVSENPTILNSTTNNGSGLGSFTSNITGLNPGTKYYIRAYATNSAGSSYGTEFNFTTSTIVPTITTVPVSEISGTSVKSGGDITSTGGSTILDKGVCWATTLNPSTSDNVKSEGTGSGTFESIITGLAPGTAYHIRAYATNSVGTAYGANVSFSTIAVAPTVTTAAVTGITTTSATCGGNVISAGGGTVTAYGVCWSTTLNPTISDIKTNDGTGTGIFTSSISGLTAGVGYHVRAYATNSTSTGYGEDVPFTAGANLATLTTASVSAITTSSATCGGTISSDGGSSVTAHGVCWNTSPSPTISNFKSSDGPGSGIFTSTLPSLSPNVHYYVKAYATNSAGTSYGQEVEFTTLTDLPSLTTTPVSAGSPSCMSGIGGGNITSDGGAAITVRGVCWSSTNSSPTISNDKSNDGTGSGPFSSTLPNLVPNTLYYVRAYATNSAGTKYGNGVQYTTTGQATVTTGSPSGIAQTTTTVSGNVNAHGTSAVVTFDYGTTTGYGTYKTATQSPVSGSSDTPVSYPLTGLTANTTYHFRVKAENTCGTITGFDNTFKTLANAPTVATSAASSIFKTTATLNGTVNAQGASTTVIFDYGTTVSYGSAVAAVQSPLTGTANTNVSLGIAGLAANTTYHFRVRAFNDGGTVYGSDLTFKTLPEPPSVTSNSPSGVSYTTATLNGTVNAQGATTTVTFDWGTSTGYGSSINASPYSFSTSSNTSVSANLTGLDCGVTYHYRVRAVNSGGTSTGSDQTFTTIGSVSDVDANTYNVVRIGSQVWFKKNLATRFYSDGTAIQNCEDALMWVLISSGAYCWYNNSSANKATYGALYNWYAINSATNGGKNICPTGWHVPSNTEFSTLISNQGGTAVAGGKMKETGTTHWLGPNAGATNESGFTALPGGWRNDSGGTFANMTYRGFFWTSTQNAANTAWVIYLDYLIDDAATYGDYNKHKGYSIRCLKD